MKPYEGKHETLSFRVLPSVVSKLQCLAMTQKMVARTTRHLDLAYWLLVTLTFRQMRPVETFYISLMSGRAYYPF